MTNQKKNIAVIYHAECSDGFGAAWSAWKKFGDKAIYIPMQHNTNPPEEIYGKDIYLLDYSFTIDVIKKIIPKVKSITLIDHHITSAEQMKVIKNGVLEMEHSGAVLAWQYFHPDKKIPLLLKYIEDLDLWKLEFQHIKEIGEFLEIVEHDFSFWTKMAEDFENKEGFQKYLNQGVVLYKKLERDVKKSLSRAEEIYFEGYKCLMVNSINASHVGHALVKKMPPIGIIWSRRGNKIIFSLRSDGTVDVAELASRYGGGGHKAAAGFSWKEDNFIKFKDHKLST